MKGEALTHQHGRQPPCCPGVRLHWNRRRGPGWRSRALSTDQCEGAVDLTQYPSNARSYTCAPVNVCVTQRRHARTHTERERERKRERERVRERERGRERATEARSISRSGHSRRLRMYCAISANSILPERSASITRTARPIFGAVTAPQTIQW